MPRPLSDKQEEYARLVAEGVPYLEAYREAGYSARGGNWEANAHRMRWNTRVLARIDELATGTARRNAKIEQSANRKAAERLSLSKEVLARALGPSVIGNVADFMDIDADGMPHPNFSRATYDQMAAIKSITIEEFLDHSNRLYDESTGKYRPREVRRVRFTLRDNVPAVGMVARMLGFVAALPRSEPVSRLEERLRKMTPEERDQHAQQLYKEVIERLQQDDAKLEAERMGIELIEDQTEDNSEEPPPGGIGEVPK